MADHYSQFSRGSSYTRGTRDIRRSYYTSNTSIKSDQLHYGHTMDRLPESEPTYLSASASLGSRGYIHETPGSHQYSLYDRPTYADPIVFADEEGEESIATGLSQQELLRQRARSSKHPKRKKKERFINLPPPPSSTPVRYRRNLDEVGPHFRPTPPTNIAGYYTSVPRPKAVVSEANVENFWDDRGSDSPNSFPYLSSANQETRRKIRFADTMNSPYELPPEEKLDESSPTSAMADIHRQTQDLGPKSILRYNNRSPNDPRTQYRWSTSLAKTVPEVNDGPRAAPSSDLKVSTSRSASFHDIDGTELSPIRLYQADWVGSLGEKNTRSPEGSDQELDASDRAVYLEEENEQILYRFSPSLMEHYPDPPLEMMNDEESAVASRLGFIEAVAAVVVQTAWRRYFARKLVSEIRESRPLTNRPSSREIGTLQPESNVLFYANPEEFDDMAQRMYDRAASRIQSIFRGFWTRDCLEVDHYCATVIQRMYRGHHQRTAYMYDLFSIILIQSIARRNIARDNAADILAHVILIQSLCRGYLIRRLFRTYLKHVERDNKQYSSVRKTKSIPKKELRSYQKAKSVVQKSRKFQSQGYLSPRRTLSREEIAAIAIQSIWRRYSCEMNFIRTLVDVLIVQSVARGWLARQEAYRLKHARLKEVEFVRPVAQRITSRNIRPMHFSSVPMTGLPIKKVGKSHDSIFSSAPSDECSPSKDMVANRSIHLKAPGGIEFLTPEKEIESSFREDSPLDITEDSTPFDEHSIPQTPSKIVRRASRFESPRKALNLEAANCPSPLVASESTSQNCTLVQPIQSRSQEHNQNKKLRHASVGSNNVLAAWNRAATKPSSKKQPIGEHMKSEKNSIQDKVAQPEPEDAREVLASWQNRAKKISSSFPSGQTTQSTMPSDSITFTEKERGLDKNSKALLDATSSIEAIRYITHSNDPHVWAYHIWYKKGLLRWKPGLEKSWAEEDSALAIVATKSAKDAQIELAAEPDEHAKLYETASARGESADEIHKCSQQTEAYNGRPDKVTDGDCTVLQAQVKDDVEQASGKGNCSLDKHPNGHDGGDGSPEALDNGSIFAENETTGIDENEQAPSSCISTSSTLRSEGNGNELLSVQLPGGKISLGEQICGENA